MDRLPDYRLEPEDRPHGINRRDPDGDPETAFDYEAGADDRDAEDALDAREESRLSPLGRCSERVNGTGLRGSGVPCALPLVLIEGLRCCPRC